MQLKGTRGLLFAVVFVFCTCCNGGTVFAEADKVNTIRELMARLESCWQPPPSNEARPMALTIVVSFTKTGTILGRPRVTFESDESTEGDRLQYRIAVMNALKRCTPIPFTDAMGGAVAGRPLRLMMGRKPAPNERSNPTHAHILERPLGGSKIDSRSAVLFSGSLCNT